MLPSNNTRSVLTAASAASLLLAGTTGLLAQAAAPAPPPANPPWETSAAIGITYTTGNTKTLNAIGSILTTRKDKVHEWAFGIDGSYGENIFRQVYAKQAQAALIVGDVSRPSTIDASA